MKAKFSPKFRNPYQAMARSAGPRGHAARETRAIAASSTVAIRSRTVAPQRGGTASFPIRIARNVLPQMRHIPVNAPIWAGPSRSRGAAGRDRGAAISTDSMAADRDTTMGESERRPGIGAPSLAAGPRVALRSKLGLQRDLSPLRIREVEERPLVLRDHELRARTLRGVEEVEPGSIGAHVDVHPELPVLVEEGQGRTFLAHAEDHLTL